MDRAGDANTSALPSVPGSMPLPTPPEEAEEYFNSFAETYLLNNADLTSDLGDVSGALEDPPGKLATADANGTEHVKEHESLLQFDWEHPDSVTRNPGEGAWNLNRSKQDLQPESFAPDKARVDTTGDSSEWEQTHGSLPMVTQTDSPESVLMTRQKVGFKDEAAPANRQMQGTSGPFSSHDPFQQRMPSGNQRSLRTSVSQPVFNSRCPDYPLMEHEQLDELEMPASWDRRMQHPGYYNPQAEVEWRQAGHRPGPWGEPPSDPAGRMERESPRGGMRGESSIYRMRSDMSGLPFRSERGYPPPRRQYSAELPFEMGQGRGYETMGGAMDAGFDNSYPPSRMDPYGRSLRMAGMTHQSPAYYTPRMMQGGESSQEMSRKRAREAYLQPNDINMQPQPQQQQQQERGGGSNVRSSPRIQARIKQRLTNEEQLISSLKRQIYHLDPTTKAVLKESLYRISRNTNARATGLPDAQQHRMPTRNSFVDRVVANLMYNRFQSPSLRSPMPRQGSGSWMHEQHYGSMGGGGPLGGQRIGSPSMRMGGMGEGPPMHLEESPHA